MNDPDQAADAAFAAVQHGDERAFAAWLAIVEPLLWRSLRSFAAAVDVEGIVQEALLRMWRLAPGIELSGPAASVRYAHRIARNLALDESRRRRTVALLEPQSFEEMTSAASEPEIQWPESHVQDAIHHCTGKLPRRPAQALRARCDQGGDHPDTALARELGMRLNTFHQNLSRARKLLADCLGRAGIRLEGFWP